MATECMFNELTGEEPTLNDCDKCQKRFEMPYEYCCLQECGEHYFCEACTKGIYLKGETKNG